MTTEEKLSDDNVRQEVRKRYGGYAAEFKEQGSGCCGPSASSPVGTVAEMYDDPDAVTLPDEVSNASLGCGDPVTLAALEPGQTVLDLGSGGGIDCFLAAKKVGEEGRVIGVDMTAEMIDLARRNKEKMGAENVEFRLGEIEHLPVSDNSVDVIISNCVVNLSPDKPQVFREAFRVMKPGGLLAVSDILTEAPMPEAFLKNMDSWGACISGALPEAEYVAAIEAAGFVDVEVERIYPDKSNIDQELIDAGFEDQIEDVKAGKKLVVKSEEGIDVIPLERLGLDSAPPKMFSGKVRARKP